MCLNPKTGLANELQGAIKVLVNSTELQSPVTLRQLKLSEGRATLGFEFSPSVDLAHLPDDFELLYETTVGLIAALRPSISRIDLLVAHPGEALRPPPQLSKTPPKPKSLSQKNNILLPLARYPHGQSLRGRIIAISPGHGWIYNSNTQSYRTQRSRIRWNNCGDCRGIVEDFETHEIVASHLIPLLEGAGAKVVLVRERSHAKNLSVSDDRDNSFRSVGGQFSEGNNAGGHDGKYLFSADANAEVEWELKAPHTGEHFLSTWFVAGSNRYDNAVLEVETPRNIHEFVLDQTSHGRRWSPVYSFGLNQNDSLFVRLKAPAPANAVLIADAVRLGAGQHFSGHPWWEMGAKPFAGHQDAPNDVQAIGDVSIRPIYAEWYDADIYLSVHSNASGQSNSTATGSSSYRYNCGRFSNHSSDPNSSACDDPIGSDRLQELVHGAMVDALKKDWDPNWRDRGTKVANFGELRNLDDMPGVLLETAFHDNVRLSQNSALKMTDNQALHDPRFRDTLAYGIYTGISRYFDATAPLLAPPPEAMIAKRVDATTVEISFTRQAEAISHRLYTACGHPSFDRGRLVEKSPVRITDLTPGEICFFKLSALNAAGEGVASKIITARPSLRPAQVLLVDAYQRRDAWVEVKDNPLNTLMVHGAALGASEVAFDSVTEEAVSAELIDLLSYDALVFALGRESVEHEVLTDVIRQKLIRFDGAIFASGSEITWSLDNRGNANSRTFLQTVFGAAFAEDDAGANAVSADPGDWFKAIQQTIQLEDGTGYAIEARSSDVILPQGEGEIALTYSGPNTVAGVRKGKNMLLGFALDSVQSATLREALLSSWASQAINLAPEERPPPEPSPDAGPIDTGIVDAGFADAGIMTAEPQPDAQTATTTRGFRALSEDPIRGGCRCDHSNRESRKQQTGWLFTLLLGLAIVRVRARL